MAENCSNALLLETYIENEASLTRYLATFFVQREEIEDTLQQAFLKTMISGATTEIQSPKDYLFRVARNIALNKKTRQKKIFFENVGMVDEVLAGELAATAFADLSEQLYSEEKFAAFAEAVDALPPRCRDVFLQQRIEGRSYREIGERLGISVRTVEKHLEKGLRLCAAHLAERGFAESEVSH